MQAEVLELPKRKPKRPKQTYLDPIALGRAAWKEYLEAQEVGFAQLMLVGAALLIGRNFVMQSVGVDTPVGRAYIDAWRAWLKANGFGDMPRNWRMDLVWCAANAEKVEAARAQYRLNHSKGEPSVNPRSMRHAAHKLATSGPSAKRVAPTVSAVRVEILCSQISERFETMPSDQALPEIELLIDALEAAAQRFAPRSAARWALVGSWLHPSVSLQG